MNRTKIVRITTVPESMLVLLKGQLNFVSQNGFDVVGISSFSSVLEIVEKEEKIRTISIDMSRKITPLRDFFSLCKLVLVLIREKPEIVHTHSPKAGIVGMMASWLTGVPHRLHTVAGMPLIVATGKKKMILTYVEKMTYFFATRIYPNSKGLYDYIVENGYTIPLKLKLLGNGSSNGIDTDFFDPTVFNYTFNEEFRLRNRISTDDFVYLFVGRLVGDKGVNELVIAFNKLSEIKRNIKLILVGVFEEDLDPLDSYTLDVIRENEHIILTGHQSDVRPYFFISNLFVFPSYREGFPNVVLQSCSMDLPVIATNINGCNEIIKDQVNGFLIPPNNIHILYDKMLYLYENKGVLDGFSKNCRNGIIRLYDRKLIWEAILKEYNQLID